MSRAQSTGRSLRRDRRICHHHRGFAASDYNVIRVADEIIVDLMRSAGGIEYAEAAQDAVMREIQGVTIPFASPRLLWRMKVVTHREKDAGDLAFLRYWFRERGQEPPK